MKKGKALYLSAFLCGVIITNILESNALIDSSYLYRYNLMRLNFEQIDHDAYLIQLLLLRIRILGVLWILGKIVPTKALRYTFGIFICVLLGMIFTLSIIANGIWGIIIMFAIMFPQWIFYMGAFALWEGYKYQYSQISQKKWDVERTVVIVLLVIIGCVCESYISPLLVNYVIKY